MPAARAHATHAVRGMTGSRPRWADIGVYAVVVAMVLATAVAIVLATEAVSDAPRTPASVYATRASALSADPARKHTARYTRVERRPLTKTHRPVSAPSRAPKKPATVPAPTAPAPAAPAPAPSSAPVASSEGPAATAHTAPAPSSPPTAPHVSVPAPPPTKVAPKPKPAPPVAFDEHGTTPATDEGAVPFDNSGGGSAPGQ
jgi:hypothetical protein